MANLKALEEKTIKI